MFCLLQMFNATYIIFTSTEEAHLEGTVQVRQVRSRMTSAILVDFMVNHQLSNEFHNLVLSIYEHVKSQPERSEEDTQPVDMEIRRLIVESVLNTFTSLKDHVSDLDSVEMSPDNYKKLVDECYKLRKYESQPFRFAIKKDLYMYGYDDYYINLIVGLIAIAYIDHANAFVYSLYENEDFRRSGAEQFFKTTRCNNNLALAAFLTPHSDIIIKPIDFDELINENFNPTEMIQNLLGRQPTASDRLVHFYSLKAFYDLVYGHVDPKQDDEDILEKIAEESASILNFNHMISRFSRAGINQTDFFRNMTKVDQMKTFPLEITVPNIPDFAKFMTGTIQKLRLLIEVNKKYSSGNYSLLRNRR